MLKEYSLICVFFLDFFFFHFEFSCLPVSLFFVIVVVLLFVTDTIGHYL